MGKGSELKEKRPRKREDRYVQSFAIRYWKVESVSPIFKKKHLDGNQDARRV